ncbi:hypothetical protein ABIE44_003635 [Marmoricola sp. OAE513]|uniref:PH-like domain-containing protein n=1 Tax=Marmoricola sp. OAE513 TaxID=2817894 RepID=UPI001AEB3FB0
MGLFRRAADGVPKLIEIPKVSELPPAKLNSAARYLGTVDADGQRVIGQTLAAKSSARLSLSTEALDVVRMAGSFRIPVSALRGATKADQFLGKSVPDLLVVRWVYEGNDWRTGFRMEASRTLKDAAKKKGGTAVPQTDDWVRTISKLSRGNA